MSLTSIEEEISRFSPTERAMLNEETIRQTDRKWAAESEKRIDAVDRGDLQAVDGASALQQLRSSLGK
jgi:hypothetical protein